MLKYELDSQPAAELASYYTQAEDGKFRLNVEGVVPASQYEAEKQKVKTFRDTNTNLLKSQKELSSFAELFGGVDKVSPEVLQQKIDELASRRAEEMAGAMKSKYDEEAKSLRDGLTQTSTKLSQLMLGDAVQKAGLQCGVHESAYDDVMNRAAAQFEVKDGAVVFKSQSLDAEGKPYTVQSWMAELAGKAPHLFKPSQGTGAARNAKGGNVTAQTGQKRSADDMLRAGLSKMATSSAKRLS